MSGQLTLAIDASTYRGTVAVLDGDTLLATAEVAMRGEREERLMPAVASALGAAGAAVGDLARVVAGGGPGSFTSLRIGGAIAKGICTACRVPLFAMPSLALLVAGANKPVGDGTYIAVLDAMRGDVHATQVCVRDGRVVSIGDLHLVGRSSVAALAARHAARVIGLGEEVDAMPHARGLALLDAPLVTEVSLATWEPMYGRLAEAQVKWEAEHGRSLATG